MIRLGLALLLLGGCAAILGIGDPEVESSGDVDAPPGAADAPIAVGTDGPPGADARSGEPDAAPEPDAPDFCYWRYYPSHIDPCHLPPSNGTLNLGSDAVLDTDAATLKVNGQTTTLESGTRPQVGAGELRIVVFDSFGLGAKLRVVGSRPLVLVSLGNVTIQNGEIDVSAVQNPDGTSTPGPGGNDPIACALSSGAHGKNAVAIEGGGGGGGGGFGAVGGMGGAGGGSSAVTLGGKGWPLDGEPLHGGCSSGAGGTSGLLGGSGGAGGGALHISAFGDIGVTEATFLRANGAGGQGGLGPAGAGGGGGGGSGGAIWLEAYAQVILGVNASPGLCANGGSGGEGASPGAGGNGKPEPCSAVMRAVSDANNVPGGDGGRGGYAPQVAGEDGAAGTTAGGGGGGGAAGRIRLYEIFSPPPLIDNAEVSPNPIFD